MPEHTAAGAACDVDGVRLPTVTCEHVSRSQINLSFEQAAEKLQTLPRLYLEMDGSFVWAGRERADLTPSPPQADAEQALKHSERAWQMYGMLYDYGGRLQRVEFQGSCPLHAWQALLSIFSDGEQALIALLVQHQCFVTTHCLEKIWELEHV